ncbi:hypothetical protein [Ferruginibacter sp. HRS2-29]|uniref:hypothetical protein n=1 Tax=Ferruginibacter sp. HRS2-29 TaxID=2487334 RepID=UPI0020CC8C23|nr:hypothetical protein [Ferruginibacter sp. HRS2-29]MCP9751476.1 hypothetical protein [Ferruginibacter sp. HRS2-29]MCP9752265.1 hypothetical protein [Ferruginibacter sp. HRS2-29]MCP9752831.1 hypothetical protein [Ferruginibacter sp. HRS2-29]
MDQVPETPNLRENNDVIELLEKAGYFKYAAQEDIAEIKEELREGLRNNYLNTAHFYTLANHSKDYRYYMLDGETLFEDGGFTDAFKYLQYVFDAIGLEFEVTNHIEEADLEKVNHSMIVNGKDYVIFKDFPGYGWGEAAKAFAEIVNEQLFLQEKDERVFLYNGGNDGAAVLLTPELFEIIDKAISDPHGKPLLLDKWCRTYGVK